MDINRRDFNKLMLAVVAGIFAGCERETTATSEGETQIAEAETEAEVAPIEKHACKGLNDCKGQGGCSTGDAGCAGKNSCKGQGGCATADKHACKGQNECKGQGGCKTGDNGCAGKNSCKGNGGCAVPVEQG